MDTQDLSIWSESSEKKDRKGVALCFPHRGKYIGELVHLFGGLISSEKYRFMLVTSNSTSIPSNRNSMVNCVLSESGEVEWILQIDADQVVDPRLPIKMIKSAEKTRFWCKNCERVSEEKICEKCGDKLSKMDVRVLSAFTFIYQRNLPVPLVPQGKGDIQSKLLNNSSLIRSNRAGTGCLLTHTSVFNEIEKPYFNDKLDENGEREEAEDFAFAYKLHQAGIPSFIDWDIVAGHKNKISLKRATFALNTAFASENFEDFSRRF